MMKVRNQNFKLSILAVAVSSAFASMAVYADDEEAAALMKPVNSVEVGVITSSQDSAKFGEYSGINKSGVKVNGAVNARFGGAYDNLESGDTSRWSVKADDLGLSSRSVNISGGDQGSWSIGFGYDELTHNLSNTYQTPYLGNIGGNTFSLPSGFSVDTTTTNCGYYSGTYKSSTTTYSGCSVPVANLDTSTNGKYVAYYTGSGSTGAYWNGSAWVSPSSAQQNTWQYLSSTQYSSAYPGTGAGAAKAAVITSGSGAGYINTVSTVTGATPPVTYPQPYLVNSPGGVMTVINNGQQTAGTNGLNANQLHNLDISTTRKNSSVNASLIIDRGWNIAVDYNHLDQSGAKLQAFGSAQLNGAKNEVISILPMPTNYTTDTVNLTSNWTTQNAHLTAAYMGSFFRDGYDRINFQAYSPLLSGGPNLAVNTISGMQSATTAPGNTLHQFSLAGGYAIDPATKLTGNVSYGRNTQNTSFVTPDSGMAPSTLTPGSVGNTLSSLNGVVVTEHADVKLVNQTNKDLILSAGFKHDLRDNQTASNIYNYNAISGSNTYAYPNTPLSVRKDILDLAADYKIDSQQRVRLSYAHENIDRWCNSYATLGAAYPVGNSCVVAGSSGESKLDGMYKLKATETLDFKLGLGYADRVTNSNSNAITSMIGQNGGTQIAAGIKGLAGVNAGDFIGYYPYFDATRTQQIVKIGGNWSATDKLTFGLNGRYNYDKYGDSIYGVQNGSSYSVNFDATYAYRDSGSISAYATQQTRRRDMHNLNGYTTTSAGYAVAGIANTWDNTLKSKDFTLGLNFKESGLLSNGKLTLQGDMAFSHATSGYSTAVNYQLVSTSLLTVPQCDATQVMSCGVLPDIKSNLIAFKLRGSYQVDKSSQIALQYVYQRLISNDYYYNALQLGSTPTTVMPTNQLAPNYTVNMVGLSYIYKF